MVKTALVTGGALGIGRAISLKLSEDGYRLVINYRGHEKEALDLVKEIKDAGGQALALQADISSEADATGLVAQIEEQFGHVDVLVNNAGINIDNLALRTKRADFEKILEVNVLGSFMVSRAVLRKMSKQRWGRIINVSSVVGLSGNVGQLAYGASKAALINMTRTLAKEVASRQLTVNAVAPGFIETDMTRALSEKTQADICKRVPLGRFGRPEEVAQLVSFLASEKSDYMTGQTLVIDGGLSL